MKRHRAVQLTQLKTMQFIASNRHDVERVLERNTGFILLSYYV
ncbi:hypothetical protein VCR26J2_270039 [Vibrio coralliirubri]|nr:hypothetical protein VCR26J2_270039 [Vibrio coralliirubri]